MINYRTTLPGVIMAILNLAVLFGLDISAEMKAGLVSSFTTIGVLVIGIYAKDSNVTGGTKRQ